jgi:hypothetical protein
MPVNGLVDDIVVFRMASYTRFMGSDANIIKLEPSAVLKINCTPRSVVLFSLLSCGL